MPRLSTVMQGQFLRSVDGLPPRGREPCAHVPLPSRRCAFHTALTGRFAHLTFSRLDLAPWERPTVGLSGRPARPGKGARVDEDLVTIGVFARRSWLSPKALRLYERQGLLLAAAVEERNGYRWYREEQLETARLIARLRRLDMPLATVVEI